MLFRRGRLVCRVLGLVDGGLLRWDDERRRNEGTSFVTTDVRAFCGELVHFWVLGGALGGGGGNGRVCENGCGDGV